MDAIALYASASESASDSEPESEPGPGPTSTAPALAPAPSPDAVRPGAGTEADTAASMPPPTRLRTFPHVAGNWATHVFVPTALTSPLRAALECAVDVANARLAAIAARGGRFVLLAERDMHISLSHTAPLRHHQLDPFAARLTRRVRQPCFPVQLGGICCMVNDERVRSFLAIRVAAGSEALRALQALADDTMSAFGQRTFYAGAVYHVSFAWCAGDVGGLLDADRAWQARARLALTGLAADDLRVTVDAVRCSFGHRERTIALPRR